jgi:hypothetical protein
MSEVEEVGGERKEVEGGPKEDDRYLVIEYEEDPIENYNTRLLAIGLALSFLFGLIVGTVAFLRM